MESIGNYYVLNHLTLLTGLTERTLRHYITLGVLEGEKINGMWHFTPEQADRFIRNPAVRPSILAKQNALVYDFLLEDRKTAPEACIILDAPETNRKALAEFFCDRINHVNFHKLRFAFDGAGPVPRVILSGDAADVFRLAQEYQESDALCNDAKNPIGGVAGPANPQP